MANYWTEKSSDGFHSDYINDLNNIESLQLDTNGTFYASGADIDFYKFFSLTYPFKPLFIILDTEFDKISFQRKSELSGFGKCDILFEKCKVNLFEICDFSIYSIRFVECEIIELDVVFNRNKAFSIEIANKTRILKIFLKSLSVNLSIGGDSEIGSIEMLDVSNSNIILNSIKVTQDLFFNSGNQTSFNISSSKINQLCINHSSITSFVVQQSSCDVKFNVCDLKSPNSPENKLVTFDFLRNESLNIQFFKLKNSYKTEFNITYLNCNIVFNNCYLEHEVMFKGEQISGNLTICNSIFREFVSFEDAYEKCLILKESQFSKGIFIPIISKNKLTDIHSSIWRILKDQAIRQNDNVNALSYRKNEYNSYRKELNWLCDFQDKVVLWLNHCSNRNGISWIRGVVFTAKVWLICFSAFTIAKNNFSEFLFLDSSFWSDAFNYLWLPQGINELSIALKSEIGCISKFVMAFFFILGKIGIAYGIFQTVSAFRRHGKS